MLRSDFMKAAPVRILAVDDNPTILLCLRHIFIGSHYVVTGAESGLEALAKLEADPDSYDVIIVDQKMPNLTGVELIGEMRERGIVGKVIVLAAELASEIREAFQRMDVHVMFSKPFDVEQLRSAVEHLAA
jgi:CheY-like chemotaxis protein